jgi:hypothetical protein
MSRWTVPASGTVAVAGELKQTLNKTTIADTSGVARRNKEWYAIALKNRVGGNLSRCVPIYEPTIYTLILIYATFFYSTCVYKKYKTSDATATTRKQNPVVGGLKVTSKALSCG